MRRAYSPRLGTVQLAREIEALPGIDKVVLIPPARGQGTRVRVFSGRDGWGARIGTTFTLEEARAWLRQDQAE